MKNMKKLVSIVTMFALVALGASIAQEGADATLDRGTFAAVDGDRDGMLTLGEFGTGLFEVVAAGETELGQGGFEAFLDSFASVEFDVTLDGIDVNNDGVLTANKEFTPGLAAHVFEAWDENDDASLSEEEYRVGWFAVMDADGDGYVTEEEYAAFEDWFGGPYAAVGEAGTNGVAEADFLLPN